MAANSTNRETVRDAFVALLTSGLVGSGKPVQAVYGYQTGDFNSQSPVVVVSSSGSEREKFTLKAQRSLLYFNIFVFVLYSDKADWGEDDAEDAVDLIEKEIADLVRDNRQTANWTDLQLEGRSLLSSLRMTLGGEEYRLETMTVRMEVID
jgi:hypothetical protein